MPESCDLASAVAYSPAAPGPAEGLERGLAGYRRFERSRRNNAAPEKASGPCARKCGSGDREDPGSSSNTEHLFAGGVHWGASRFPLPARRAVCALQHPETDCDFPAKSRLPTSSVASRSRNCALVGLRGGLR